MEPRLYYPCMQTSTIIVNGQELLLDGEGYLLDLDAWTEEFAIIRAQEETLALNDEHWEVIKFIRQYYEEHGVQAAVRDMLKHFRSLWCKQKATSRYLHSIFPNGGPQKQGNRLAGIRKPKGEH